MSTQVLTLAEARRLKLKPLTHPYERSEAKMMERVVADMRMSGIKHAAVVEDPKRPEIYSVYRS